MATLTSKGQITIPIDVRRNLKLVTGSKLDFIADADGWYRIVPRSKSVMDVLGCISYSGSTISVEEMNKGISEAVTSEYERGN
jgi:AbrB family looped-hinge helix DNA binding protein